MLTFWRQALRDTIFVRSATPMSDVYITSYQHEENQPNGLDSEELRMRAHTHKHTHKHT